MRISLEHVPVIGTKRNEKLIKVAHVLLAITRGRYRFMQRRIRPTSVDAMPSRQMTRRPGPRQLQGLRTGFLEIGLHEINGNAVAQIISPDELLERRVGLLEAGVTPQKPGQRPVGIINEIGDSARHGLDRSALAIPIEGMDPAAQVEKGAELIVS